MKFLIAFAFLVAGITALPQTEVAGVTSERIIAGQIIAAIEGASQAIQDAGLDPIVINREAAEYALPVPVIFNAAAFIENLLCTGLSDIVVRNINFSTLALRLTFDIELPHIHVSVGDAYAQAIVFGEGYEGEASGRVVIANDLDDEIAGIS